MTPETLTSSVQELFCNRQSYIEAMTKSGQMQPILTIVSLIEKYRKKTEA